MKLNLKITPKLTLVFVLFASVVLVGISLFAYYSGRSELEAAIISDLNSTATEKQAALEAWVEEGKLNIDMIASYHHFQETISTLIASSPNSTTARTAYEHLLTTMKKWVGKNRRFLDLFVLAPESGRVIVATDPHEEGRFKEDRLYFIKGKKGPYVQNPYYRISTQIPTMTAAAPIVSAEGRLLAVLAGHLNLNELNEIILRRTGLHQTDDAFLVNTSHLFITQPWFISDPAVLQRGIHTEAVNSELAGKSGVLLDNDYRGIPSIIVYRWLPERQLCLITKIDLVVSTRSMQETQLPKGGKFTIETANLNLDKVYARDHVTVTPGPYVMISVSDTGVGMNPEVRDRVFEPFFTTKEKGKGTGLGLSTVYGIIKQSGGHIWVSSEPGKGTEFKIYLPRVDEPLEELKEKVEKEGLPRGNERILIVEDEENVLKLAGRILRRQGYEVLEAINGGEVLKICREEKKPIHLILTDVVMPQISGRELIEQCREVCQDFKVIYMSGYTDDIITHHGILQKGLDYIQKPFTVDELARKVKRVLDK